MLWRDAPHLLTRTILDLPIDSSDNSSTKLQTDDTMRIITSIKNSEADEFTNDAGSEPKKNTRVD